MSSIYLVGQSVKQTLFINIEALPLRGGSVKHFMEFRKLHRKFEKQVLEKNKQVSTETGPTSITASMEDADLNIFMAAGWIKDDSIQDITEEQLKEWIR